MITSKRQHCNIVTGAIEINTADVLELSFPFTPEFNQTVTVQPDGYITLRGVEGIRVQGQTLTEVTNSLRTVYGKILHDPVINIELKDFEKPYFIVGGEVGRPGKFDLRSETSATEAVAIAGGLKDSAKHSQVLLFHRVPDGWMQVKKLDMKKMMKNADLTEDAYLQPGDFLYVPKIYQCPRSLGKIYPNFVTRVFTRIRACSKVFRESEGASHR